jgi:hypothetical protein
MTKKQLHKQLQLIHKDLTKAETRMQKIAIKLDIDRHAYLEMTLYEIEELLKMFEENNEPS